MKKYATVQTTFHVYVISIRIASFNSFSTHIEKLDQIIEGKVGTLSFFMAPKPKVGEVVLVKDKLKKMRLTLKQTQILVILKEGDS